jgi:ABC-type antimicrobial peptide transport system permease subunit
VDAGQVWLDITKLQEITELENEATLFVANEAYSGIAPEGWVYKSRDDLLSSLYQIINTKKASSSILYVFLLAIALLAIFDTQVLSIFRRQKEIGTYISLGMTRKQVVKLFTVEGAMYSIMAAVVALILGTPLLLTISNIGIPIPEASRNAGVAMAARIYPIYGFMLLITTFILVVLAATIVSYMPARKISRMDPVNALKGKIQ